MNPRLFRRDGTGRLPRSGFTWVELVIVLFVIAILVALLLPTTRRSREAAGRVACKNNLKQIGLGLRNYHDTFGTLPPAVMLAPGGEPSHGWRVALLPFIEEERLAERFDVTKAWDDPANSAAAAAVVGTYFCPSFPDPETTYHAVIGVETWLGRHESLSFADRDADLGATLLVSEVDPPHAVPWAEPTDEAVAFLRNCTDAETVHPGGFQAVLDDGSARFISQNIATESLDALLTIGADPGEF